MLEHFKFLKVQADRAHVVPKMTIPSPSVLHFRGGRKSVSQSVYPDINSYFEDLGKTYRKAVKAFYDAGCRYLQFDDTVWAYLCSKEEMEKFRARGEDADDIAEIYARTINYADRRAAGRHDDHHARLPRQFPLDLDRVRRLRAGRRDPARRHQLRRLLPRIRHRPRRRLRAAALPAEGQQDRVVGLVTSKSGTLEKKDDIKRRLDEAAKFAPLEQLALSPQCGFASTEEGNILTEDEQWKKLEFIVEIANEVWGNN